MYLYPFFALIKLLICCGGVAPQFPVKKEISMKDLGEAAYILGIKIYRDRSRCLIRLSMSTYLDKILKEFKMDQSKKEFLHVL